MPLPTPTLHTQRLLLRPFAEADADAIYALQSNARVLRYWDSPPWTDRERARAFIDTCRKMEQEGSGARFAIESRADRSFLGWCSLFRWNPVYRSLGVGYCFDEPAWGRGYATEAMRAVLHWAFGALDLNRVEAELDTRNAASARVLEKLGFQREGLRREDCIVEGEVSDSWIYGLLRKEWPAEAGSAVPVLATPTRALPLASSLQESPVHLAPTYPLEGGCDCRAVRYRLKTAPLFVHCCHCRWCQRESGAAFALNAMIESDRVESLGVEPELVQTPSESGLGQKIARCPTCKLAVWSHYAGSGPLTKFVRVGTLDNPDLLPPDVHIFTASKQPWVQLPEGTPAVTEYYERETLWPEESLARRRKLLPLIEAYQRQLQAPT